MLFVGRMPPAFGWRVHAPEGRHHQIMALSFYGDWQIKEAQPPRGLTLLAEVRGRTSLVGP
jgi:hypothetical protein